MFGLKKSKVLRGPCKTYWAQGSVFNTPLDIKFVDLLKPLVLRPSFKNGRSVRVYQERAGKRIRV